MTYLHSHNGSPPVASAPLLKASNLSKSFSTGRKGETVQVLRGISLTVLPGELVAIVGQSGSGKSTLLYCLSTLESCSSGSVEVLGVDAGQLRMSKLRDLRRDRVGFVFQQFNLIPYLTARENVALPRVLAKQPGAIREADDALAAVGLTSYADARPGTLSGGQQQRVAIARVLAGNADIVFADEPTGSLDSANGTAVLDLLRKTADGSRSVVMVTHDLEAASRADRVLVLRDGRLCGELSAPSATKVLHALEAAASLEFRSETLR